MKPDRARATVRPWATAAAVAVALALSAWPALAAPLLYERREILAGELWRVATGHFVHFGASHLAWNALVVLVAGSWAETLAPGRVRFYWVTAPVVIGLTLLALDPALATYGGLSGLATGLVVLLSAELWRRGGRDRTWAAALFGLTALKLLADARGFGGVVRYADDTIRSVPLAHAAGAIWAAAVVGGAALRRRTAQRLL